MAATTNQPNYHRRGLLLAALLIVGVACLSITGRSFWIDECVTAGFANDVEDVNQYAAPM